MPRSPGPGVLGRDAHRKGSDHRGDDVDVATAALAQDVLARLEAALGADAVAQAVSTVAAALKKKRVENRAKRAVEAVADPAAAAKRKLARGADKAKSRKRKGDARF